MARPVDVGDIAPPVDVGDGLAPAVEVGDYLAPPVDVDDLAPLVEVKDLAPPVEVGDLAPPVEVRDLAPRLEVGDLAVQQPGCVPLYGDRMSSEVVAGLESMMGILRDRILQPYSLLFDIYGTYNFGSTSDDRVWGNILSQFMWNIYDVCDYLTSEYILTHVRPSEEWITDVSIPLSTQRR
jgi:hypothetical protein